MHMLEFQDVSYQYPGEDFDIIDRLSFSVAPGSFHCIIGISGCGKSTIFRMTNGLLQPKAGTILVEGQAICMGYANTFQLFMDLLDIPCITVIGASSGSREDHAWNLVQLDGLDRCTTRPT